MNDYTIEATQEHNPQPSANRTVAETIVQERSGIRLVETIEYYLNELDRLENKGAS